MGMAALVASTAVVELLGPHGGGSFYLANLALIKGVHGWFYRVAERSLGKPAGARASIIC
jgi:hypothetical protein